jgi:hypothetical protein
MTANGQLRLNPDGYPLEKVTAHAPCFPSSMIPCGKRALQWFVEPTNPGSDR